MAEDEEKSPLHGIDELRRVVRCADATRESTWDGLTAEEVIRVVRACWRSGWDIFADNLTPQQLERARLPRWFATSGEGARMRDEGEVPRFEDRGGDLHALGVTDCRCGHCRRAEHATTESPPVSP